MGVLKFVAGGSRASDTMTPGHYHVRCAEARAIQRGRAPQIILTFQVAEGAWNDGVELKQWYNLQRSGRVSPHTKYAKAWELAAGKEMQAGNDVDPRIFIGELFQAYVGYRSNSSGNDYDSRHTATKKDPRDFLRVHELEKLISEETASCHMGPFDATSTNINTDTNTDTGVGEGGSGERSIYTNKDTSK